MGKYDGKHLVYYVNGEKINADKNPRSIYLDNFYNEWKVTLGTNYVNSAVSIVRDNDKVTVITNEGETLVLSIE